MEKVCGISDETQFNQKFKDEREKPVVFGDCFFESALKFKAEVIKEPTNKADENAIRVDLISTGGRIKLGYIPAELTQYINPSLSQTTAFISHVRYRPAFKREGFYAILSLLKDTPWPKKLLAAGRGVS